MELFGILGNASIAALFAGLGGTILGFMNVLRSFFINDPPPPPQILAVGAAEALVTLFVSFGCLTVAWLCVAFGIRRHP